MGKYDVFISYSRNDYQDEEKNIIEGNAVSKIKNALDNNKISYWIDEDGIYSGDNFAPVIGRAIKESSVFVFVSSVNSNSSQWVQNEVGVANHYRKPIIPIRLDESEYADNIVMYLTVLDFCEYYANQENALKKLVKAIKEKLPKTKRIENESNNENTKYQKELLSSIHNIGDQMLEVSQIAVSKLLNNTDRMSYEMRERIEKSESVLHEILSCEEESKQKHDGYFKAYLDDSHGRFNSMESLIIQESTNNIIAIERNTESLKEISSLLKKHTEDLLSQIKETNNLLKQIYGSFNRANSLTDRETSMRSTFNKSMVSNIIFVCNVLGCNAEVIDVLNNSINEFSSRIVDDGKGSIVSINVDILTYSTKGIKRRTLVRNSQYNGNCPNLLSHHSAKCSCDNLVEALRSLKQILNSLNSVALNVSPDLLESVRPLIIFISDDVYPFSVGRDLRYKIDQEIFPGAYMRGIAINTDSAENLSLILGQPVKILGNDCQTALKKELNEIYGTYRKSAY